MNRPGNRARQRKARRLLIAAMVDPISIAALSETDLDLTIRLTRRALLLGRLCVDLERAGVADRLPQVARDQLEGAKIVAESRAHLAKWELNQIARALRDEPAITPIAMKGCAYLLLRTPNARGRNFADVDLMFSEELLEEVEKILNTHGWKSAELSPYDDNYYRKWTHELPPLMHVEREMEVDLHHTILPRTARLKPDARLLLVSAKPVAGTAYSVLSDELVVLHAITHLMFGDDLADKFRELVDILDLVLHFSSTDENFWNNLLECADALDLRRPTYYALRYLNRLLDFELPTHVSATTEKWAPPAIIVSLMDRLVPRSLFPPHPDYPSNVTEICRGLLFVRSHWIRMPPWLLAYHLAYKFYMTRIRRVPREHT